MDSSSSRHARLPLVASARSHQSPALAMPPSTPVAVVALPRHASVALWIGALSLLWLALLHTASLGALVWGGLSVKEAVEPHWTHARSFVAEQQPHIEERALAIANFTRLATAELLTDESARRVSEAFHSLMRFIGAFDEEGVRTLTANLRDGTAKASLWERRINALYEDERLFVIGTATLELSRIVRDRGANIIADADVLSETLHTLVVRTHTKLEALKKVFE